MMNTAKKINILYKNRYSRCSGFVFYERYIFGLSFSGAGNLLSTAIPHYAAEPLHSGIFVAIRAKVVVVY
ncbi:hypothetical protein [Chryseobacterium taichungense]|uniref:hypothetical protein n=1 Tax=Chryseobacterium taichungense TaxID=295069 RepID=UPI00115FB7A6|nr:hypothetical protein [Chryseobacterium taichungense]